ncbi:hypothetical protein MNBD_GAMMA16-1392 [hydrothermal vent metagenome]|uniref:Lipoprotein n=1 Tax=hydrothermal vent metagenome TaxID=652676 RepID=A0A3B0Z3V4_9ZZZZ
MKYAESLWRLSIISVVVVVLISGCIVFEQTSAVSNKGRKVLFQNQYSSYYELQELSRFTAQYEGLKSKKELSSLLTEVESNFANGPNLLNRYKLIFLLAYTDESEASTETILSLIGDINSKENGVDSNQSQSERFLLFFGEQYRSWVKKNLQLNQQIRFFQAEKVELEQKNQMLKNKLFVSEAERKKVNDQLAQLKSIEASIIKRDMNEGTTIP